MMLEFHSTLAAARPRNAIFCAALAAVLSGEVVRAAVIDGLSGDSSVSSRRVCG